MPFSKAAFCSALLSLLCLSHAAAAQDENPAVSAVFHCAPPGFSMTLTETGIHVSGDIPTPTPGYSYDFTPDAVDSTPESVHGILSLSPPSARRAEVLTPLHVDEDIDVEAGVDVIRLDIDIDKTYDSGPARISCRKVAQPHD